MSLTTEGMTPADLAAVMGTNNGFGNGFGGDGWWILLLILFANGGWGMGGFGNGFGGFGNMMLGYDFPWLLNGQQNIMENTNNGFRDQMLNSSVNNLQNSVISGFGDVQNSLCGGFADVNASIANGFAQSEIAANGRQMANMNQAFNAQTAMMQGFNNVQSQFADCCCENRLANCQTQNIIQNEGNATRFADANNTRDIIDATTRGNQMILDKLCQLELDGVKAQVEAKNDKISDLERQLTMANLQASQTAQNAFIAQGFNDEIDALYNRLNSCPVPTTPVYGRTPIFTCNNGCGCGNNF